MNMAIQDDLILSLEEKIKHIILVAEELRANNLQLQQQVKELSETIQARDQEMGALELKYQNLKLTKTLIASPGDIKDVKIQVNRMVREIDRCIALLNR
jgi:chromosome segregation ATPase